MNEPLALKLFSLSNGDFIFFMTSPAPYTQVYGLIPIGTFSTIEQSFKSINCRIVFALKVYHVRRNKKNLVHAFELDNTSIDSDLLVDLIHRFGDKQTRSVSLPPNLSHPLSNRQRESNR